MLRQKYFLNKPCILVVLILSLLFNSGCWDRRELKSLAIVSGFAFDTADTDNEFSMTAQIINPEKIPTAKGGGSSEGDGPFWNVSCTGTTIFDALRNCSQLSPDRLLVSHSEVIIFSEDLARQGVNKYMDFFLRDFEFRDTLWMVVAEDKAKEILNVKTKLESIPAFSIDRIIKNQSATSKSMGVNLHEFTSRVLSDTTVAIAPLIKIAEDDQDKNLRLSGMAIFNKDLQLVGKLNSQETRGLLWVLGEVKSGIITVNSPECNGKASIEILHGSSRINPKINGDKLQITIKINVESNLSEDTCSEDLLSPVVWESLNKRQAISIKNEVMLALNKSRKLNTDIFDFGDAVHKKYPNEWKNLKTRWDEIFPGLDVQVIVESQLRRPGMITKTTQL